MFAFGRVWFALVQAGQHLLRVSVEWRTSGVLTQGGGVVRPNKASRCVGRGRLAPISSAKTEDKMRLISKAMLLHLSVVTVALTLAVTLPQAQAETTRTTAVGPGGGSPFSHRCDQDMLVGIGIRQGDSVDQVHLICAAARKEGYLDAPYDVVAKSAGGRGGKYLRLVCPRNYFIRGIQLKHAKSISDIALHCLRVNDLDRYTVVTGWEEETSLIGGNVLHLTDSIDCGSNRVAYGLHGTAGALVTSLGLTCAFDPFIAAANQSQQQAPQGDGRGQWSAFAASDRGDWGFGVHQATEGVARQLAADGCGGSGVGCKVFWTTTDRCVAFAESRAGGYWYAAGGGNNQNEANANAIRFCQSGTAPANSCQVVNDTSACR